MNTTCGKDQNPTGVADGKESQGTLQETNWNCLAGQSSVMAPGEHPDAHSKPTAKKRAPYLSPVYFTFMQTDTLIKCNQQVAHL